MTSSAKRLHIFSAFRRFLSAWLALLTIFALSGALSVAFAADPASSSSASTLSSDAQKALTPVTLQLHWLHQFEFAGFYAAIEQGYYQQEGLDVTLVEADSEISIVDEVVSGRAHYGLGNADLLAHWGRGEPIVLLANLFKHSPLVVLARQDSGIRQPRDLIGRRVMTQQLDLNSAEISYMLYQARVQPEQMVRIPHSYRIDELVAGEVDAMTAYITNQTYELQAAGVPTVVIDPANYGADFYSNNIFTSQREVRNHPERVAAFRRASLKGWRYALDHPVEMVDLIYRDYSQRKAKAALHYEAREVAKLISEKAYPLGSIDPRRLRRLQDIYLLNGQLTTAKSDLMGFIWQTKDEPMTSLNLTGQEQTFIGNHPELRLCSYSGWLPYEGQQKGHAVGVGPDIIREAAQGVGLRVTDVVSASWSETLLALKERRCDLISAIVPSADRQPLINFTESYLDISNAIVTRQSQAYISDIRELQGKQVGVIGGGIHEELILRHYPDIQLRSYASMDLALNALSKGSIDGFVDTVATSGYGIRRSGLQNLHIAGLFPYKTPLAVGVRSDWPELQGLLQKSLNRIPEGRMNEIIRHWVQFTAEPQANMTMLWRAAVILLILLAVFLIFYSRLRRANRALAREVTQRRKAEEASLQLNDELLVKNQQLETLSRTDALTGLYNRYHIESTLEEQVVRSQAHQQQLSVLLLDLDHFKQVNDRHGHHVGDLVLKEFASLIRDVCDENLIAGRWGGEEFLLILPGADLSKATRIADQFRQHVVAKNFPEIGGLTVSIGVAALRREESSHGLVNRADNMLYQAKGAGRNCVRADHQPREIRNSLNI